MIAELGHRRPALFAALAGATALGAVLALLALNGGGESLPGFSISAGYDRAAYAALAKSPPDWAAVVRDSRAAARRYPYNVSALLRIAFVQAQAGRMGPEALQAIQRGYDLVAYDPELAYWRVWFCLEHWQELTPQIRRAVSAEVHTVGKERIHRAEMIRILRSIRNPAGRLAGEFWANDLAKV